MMKKAKEKPLQHDITSNDDHIALALVPRIDKRTVFAFFSSRRFHEEQNKQEFVAHSLTHVAPPVAP